MSGENEVVYSYEADYDGIMESLSAISEGIQGVLEDISALVDASSELSALDDAFIGVADSLGGVDEAASTTNEYLASLGEQAFTTGEGFDGMASTAAAAMEEIAGEADAAGAGVGDLAMAVDLGAMSFDELTGYLTEANAAFGITADSAEVAATAIDILAESMDVLSVSTAVADVALADMATAEAGAEAETGGLAAVMAGADEAIAGMGESLQAVQGPLLLISMAAIGAGAAVFDMGSKAEDALNQVQALAGVGASDMAKYTSQLETQGQQFGETLDQEAQGLFYVTSAGFQNAAAMKVLAQATEDAKAGHVDLSVSTRALDASLNAYGASADQATQYNDYMMTAVTKGVQTFGDFASAISKAAIAGNAAHISFDQVAAAESELTTVGMTARQASMDLSSMMKALDSDTGKTAKTAEGLGLKFNEASFKTMDLFHQMQYLQEITGGNQTELTKLVGGSAGIAAFNGLMTKNADGTYKFAQSLENMKHSTGAASDAFQTSQETIGSHMDKLGATFSIISYKIVTALGPHIIPIIDNVTNAITRFADYVSTHIDQLMPVLAGLAAFFGGAIIGAIAAFVISLGWIPLILLGIGAAVAGVVYTFQHWNEIIKNPAIAGLMSVLQTVGNFLSATFKPVWDQLVETFQTQLVPAWNQLTKAIQPALPYFQLLGTIVGGVLVIAFDVFISTIAGLVRGFATALPGIIRFVTGVIQIISGFVTVVLGIIGFFVDLFTGHFDKLGRDLGTIWHGIATMIGGVVNVIAGLITGTFGFILGYISGFVSTFLGFFVNLGNSLGIKVPALIGQIGDWFGALPGLALKWSGDMINGFVQGIEDGIASIGHAASDVASTIASWLHFSKPDVGPLATSDQWMKDFGDQLSSGLDDQQGKVKASSDNVANAITNSDLKKLGQTAKDIAKNFEDIAKGIDKVFGPINKSLGDLDKLGNHLDGMKKSSEDTVKAFGKLGDAIKDSTKPVKDAEGVFDGLKGSLGKAFDAINDAAPKFKKLEPAFKDLQKPIQDASKDLKSVGDAIDKAMKPVNDALKHLDNLEKSTGKISQNAKDTTKAFKDLSPAITDDAKAAERSKKDFEDLGPAFKKVQDAIKNSLPEFKKLAPALKDAEKPIGDAVANYKKIADAINKAFKPIQKALDDMKKLADQIGKMADAVTKMVKGFNDLAPAIAKSHTEASASIKPYADLQAAVNKVATEVNNQLPKFKTLASTLKDSEEPLKKATDNYKAITDALKKGFDPVNTAIDNFKKLPDAITKTHDPITKMGKDLDDLENKITKDMGDTLKITDNFGKTFEKQFDDLKTNIDTKSKNIAKCIEDALGATLKSHGYTWGQDFMTQFIAGLKSQQGALDTQVTALATTVSDQLHHTKPEKGPLADDDQWGAHFVDNLVKGMESRIGGLGNTVAGIATNLAAVNPSNLPQGPSPANSGHNAQSSQTQQQMLTALQGIQRQLLSAPTSSNLGAMTQQFSNTFNGNMDANALQQMINQLQGLQVQYSQRGALFNY